jgi:hypothetical protein
VQNAETAIKEAGSVAHRRRKLQRGYAWRARDVLHCSQLLLPQSRFCTSGSGFPRTNTPTPALSAQTRNRPLLYFWMSADCLFWRIVRL